MMVGAYRVLDELGRGGTGVVYRAVAPDGAEVAVKVLARGSAESHERFAREHRLSSALGLVDGFVPVLDAGMADRGPFIVMPLLRGGTLRARLERGALPREEAVSLVRRLATTVARAHARGIVHRDLKPENVLFDEAGTAYVADLGLAKHFRRDVAGASQSQVVSQADGIRGTAGFIPPEQLLDPTLATPAGDVFALGAILHECLTGAPAFRGDGLVNVLDAVLAGKVEPLGKAAPPWLDAVVSRALAARPDRRYPDAGALARALEGEAPRRLPVAPVAVALMLLSAAALFALASRPATAPAPPPPVAAVSSSVTPSIAPRELARRWALAAGAVFPWTHGDRGEFFAGRPIGPAPSAEDRAQLREQWRVGSREDLLKQLAWLRDHGHSAGYRILHAQIARDPDKARRQLDARADGHDRERRALVLENHARGPEAMLAWDLSRLITISGRGVHARYLDEGEAWGWIGPAAKRLQATYRSWEELAAGFLLGRRFWKPEGERKSDRACQQLLADPESPWRRYPWDVDLDAGSPWTPAPAGR